MTNPQIVRLPCYGIVLYLQEGGGMIVSDLKKGQIDAADHDYCTAIDGLESLILGHAVAGVDVESPAYLEGIETAVAAQPDL